MLNTYNGNGSDHAVGTDSRLADEAIIASTDAVVALDLEATAPSVHCALSEGRQAALHVHASRGCIRESENRVL